MLKSKIETKRCNFILPLDLVNEIDNHANNNMLSRGQVVSIGMRKWLSNEKLMSSLLLPKDKKKDNE